MTTLERMRAELEILGLDVSQHAVAAYDPFLDALGVTHSRDLLRRRSRGELRRTGRRGVSLRATGAWGLPALHELWQRGSTDEEGLALVHVALARVRELPGDGRSGEEPTQRRVLVHTSGFQISPHSDIKPAGDSAKSVARNLWHRSPGSPG